MKTFQTILRKDSTISFAYLFGSRARKQNRPNSDWDIGIYFSTPPKDEPHGKKYSELYFNISKLLKTDALDLVFLNFAPPLLAHQILKEGQVLFQKNKATYINYFVKLMGEVNDARHLLKPHIVAAKKRLKTY